MDVKFIPLEAYSFVITFDNLFDVSFSTLENEGDVLTFIKEMMAKYNYCRATVSDAGDNSLIFAVLDDGTVEIYA